LPVLLLPALPLLLHCRVIAPYQPYRKRLIVTTALLAYRCYYQGWRCRLFCLFPLYLLRLLVIAVISSVNLPPEFRCRCYRQDPAIWHRYRYDPVMPLAAVIAAPLLSPPLLLLLYRYRYCYCWLLLRRRWLVIGNVKIRCRSQGVLLYCALLPSRCWLPYALARPFSDSRAVAILLAKPLRRRWLSLHCAGYCHIAILRHISALLLPGYCHIQL
jgi:hypothetical protein